MSAAKKEISSTEPVSSGEKNLSPSSKVLSDINSLERRLADLLEHDVPGSKISFGFAVLSAVARGQYDRAMEELDSVGHGLEEYKLFEFRSRRFVEHAKSLVVAIRAKHTVGKSPNVNKSKQKELSDKIAEHFVDLKRTIITIEKIQKSVRSEDLGSTVMLFKVIYFSLAAVILVYGFVTLYPEVQSLRDSGFFEFFQWPWPF